MNSEEPEYHQLNMFELRPERQADQYVAFRMWLSAHQERLMQGYMYQGRLLTGLEEALLTAYIAGCNHGYAVKERTNGVTQ